MFEIRQVDMEFQLEEFRKEESRKELFSSPTISC
jgi:hypothetical protein